MNRAPDTPEVVLRLRGVCKRYGSITAVSNLDLDVHDAEVMALLGPNGAGKTTTVEMCEGFVRPDAGSIEVLGLDPITDNARLRARIGVMLQGGGGYPAARAGEMLDLVAPTPPTRWTRTGYWTPWVSPRPPAPPIDGSPAGSSNDSRWPARWSGVPNWCSSTSPPRAWMPMPGYWCGS